MQEHAENPESVPTQRERLLEVAAVFTKLGFTAFGGPAAHVALMEDEFVHRRKWLDRDHFLDLLSAVNFIPGPNSTEMAIHLGLIRAGFWGLVIAGVCFITPAVLIILPIAYFYVKYGSLPQVQPAMRGVSIAVTAIVMVATLRLLKSSGKDGWTFGVIAASCGGWFLLRWLNAPQPDLCILLIVGIAGGIRYWFRRNINLRLFSIAPLGMLTADELHGLGQTILLFLKIGLTLFGSGYVLVTYLQTGLVDERHWLTHQQMMDAIAVGQFTPGPLLTAATFVGFVLGATQFGGGLGVAVSFAIGSTIAIFLPAFVLIVLLAPLLQRIRSSGPARGILDSLNSAVVGLLLATTGQLLRGMSSTFGAMSITNAVLSFCVFGLCVFALIRQMNSTWVLLASGAASLALRWL